VFNLGNKEKKAKNASGIFPLMCSTGQGELEGIEHRTKGKDLPRGGKGDKPKEI